MGNAFPALIDPGALGDGGFKLQGESNGRQAGYSVSHAGDVNDDGRDDLIIGARFGPSITGNGGAAYVVFGIDTPGGFPGLLDLGQIAQGNGGFKIAGDVERGSVGASVSSAGDVNSDGIEDLIIGADNSSGAGAAYVVFGSDQGFPALVDLDSVAQGSGGFKILGENSGDQAGISVAGAGDVNDDGHDDVIVGAEENNGGAGAAYVVFGSDQGLPSVVDLDVVALGNGGFKIKGENGGDLAGGSVSGAGDINGDGVDDVVIGAIANDSGGSSAGAAYVVFGDDQGFPAIVDLAAVAQGNGGFKIQGENEIDRTGVSVSSAGDVNGDGRDDIVVGSQDNNLGAGAAYVIFGRDAGQGFPAVLDLEEIAQGIGGFKILSEATGDRTGIAVSGAGDLNGDGVDDVVVGSLNNDSGGNNAGAAYVVFGSDAGFTAPVDLTAVAQGQGGFKVEGERAADRAGFAVSSAGDLDGDGIDDLVVGAYDNSLGTGAAYVIYGNIAPVARDDTAGTGFETPVSIDVLGNDSDANGELDRSSVAVVSQGAKGEAVANADGSITYTPDGGAEGVDSFTYTVGDDKEGTSSAATVTVTIASEYNVIDGTERPDLLFGTNDADRIQALGGDDAVFARGGDDLVLGGANRDSLVGESGDDTLFGGAGGDAISGGSGLDILVGGPGNDTLAGGSGLDTAIFAGNYADHRVTGIGTWRTVRDLEGDGGRDSLTSVELLQFDNGVFDARNGRFTEGGYATTEVEALVTSPGFSTDPEPILAPVA